MRFVAFGLRTSASKPSENSLRDGFGLLGQQRMACVSDLDERHAMRELGGEPLRILRYDYDIVAALEHEHRRCAACPPVLQRSSAVAGALRPCRVEVPALCPHARVFAGREE